MSGTVYGIGVGPGDPELITVRALKLLQSADVIAYPAPEQGDSFARAIAAPHLPAGRIEIVIRMPIGDGQFPKHDIYDRAADEIAAHAAAGRTVAVLCEGDPFFYGSFMYLHERLAERCLVKIVPGVSSLMACAGAAGLPLVVRNEALIVIPAPIADDQLRARLADCEAAAIVKVGRHLSRVRAIIGELGLTEQAWYVERATLAAEQVLPLARVKPENAPYFSMILVRRRKGVG